MTLTEIDNVEVSSALEAINSESMIVEDLFNLVEGWRPDDILDDKLQEARVRYCEYRDRHFTLLADEMRLDEDYEALKAIVRGSGERIDELAEELYKNRSEYQATLGSEIGVLNYRAAAAVLYVNEMNRVVNGGTLN